ncbi:hypothetical protein OG361_02560 [Streptomyces sp. NBC_00090]|uniref:hypothetical protein n=1 Tax=Streptomyces sp. NBC_00090 TaxID=2903619 RepID=UPI0032463D9F
MRHGRTLEHYRAALEVHALSTSKSATTEQMRGAMTHYRTLFDDSVRAQKFSNDLLHPYRYSDLRLLAEHDGRPIPGELLPELT